MKRLKTWWNSYKQDISIFVAILGIVAKVLGIGLDIYEEIKTPQCEVPPTVTKVQDVEVGEADES